MSYLCREYTCMLNLVTQGVQVKITSPYAVNICSLLITACCPANTHAQRTHAHPQTHTHSSEGLAPTTSPQFCNSVATLPERAVAVAENFLNARLPFN